MHRDRAFVNVLSPDGPPSESIKENQTCVRQILVRWIFVEEFSDLEVRNTRIDCEMSVDRPVKFGSRLRADITGPAETVPQGKSRHVIKSIVDALPPKVIRIDREARAALRQLYGYARSETLNVQRAIRLNHAEETTVRKWSKEGPQFHFIRVLITRRDSGIHRDPRLQLGVCERIAGLRRNSPCSDVASRICYETGGR
jgi:hypothetical protein